MKARIRETITIPPSGNRLYPIVLSKGMVLAQSSDGFFKVPYCAVEVELKPSDYEIATPQPAPADGAKEKSE